MVIYDILMMDHRNVMQVLDAIERVQDPERRRDLFSFFRTELTMHAKAEEEVFYRPLRDLTQGDMIEGAFADHDELDRSLADIQGSSARDEDWMDKIRMLRANLERHVQKEESDLFALAQQHYSTEEAEDIGIRMMEEKGKLGMENPIAVMGRKLKELVE